VGSNQRATVQWTVLQVAGQRGLWRFAGLRKSGHTPSHDRKARGSDSSRSPAMLRVLGLIERAGSGMSSSRSARRDVHFPRPEAEVDVAQNRAPRDLHAQLLDPKHPE
jgi:hypothetical protein